MTPFLAALLQNARDLPSNLRRGLFPGGSEASPPRPLRRGFLGHLHALEASERTLAPATTLGLGLTSLTLFLLLAASGALLMVYYAPAPRDAYGSVQDLEHAIALGGFLRALHRWSAHAMVLSVALHLLRVAATASYRRRELNWIFGLALLALTLGLAFTGYLLPWDQLSYWAVNVSAGLLDQIPLAGPVARRLLLGGSTLSAATLLRFYTLHVAILPVALFALAALHLFRIRRDGGLAGTARDAPLVSAWPHLVLREATLMISVAALAGLAALLLAAPLGSPADPHVPSDPEKAPWYFLWLQELVSYSATAGGFLFPGALALLLLALPFAEREEGDTGRWLGGARSRRAVLLGSAVAAAAFALFETLWLRATAPRWPDLLNPATGMLAVGLAVGLWTGARTGSSRAALLGALAVLAVAIAGALALGACRGPGWILLAPWEAWARGG